MFTAVRLSKLLLLLIVLQPYECIAIDGHTLSAEQLLIKGQRINLSEHGKTLQLDAPFPPLDTIVGDYLDKPELWLNNSEKKPTAPFAYPFTWKKFNLANTSEQPLQLILVCTEPGTRRLHTALIIDGEIQTQTLSGSQTPYSRRALKHQLLLHPITVQPQQEIILLVGSSLNNSWGKLWLAEERSFWRWDNQRNLTDGAYLGSVGILSLMVILLYINSRDKTVLFFYLLIISNMLHHIIRNGLADQMFFSNTGGLTRQLTYLAGITTVLMAILSIVYFLKLKDRNKYITLFISKAVFLFNIVILVLMLSVEASFHISTIALISINTLYFLGLWIDSFRCAISGHRTSKIYCLASFAYILPTSLKALYNHFFFADHPPLWLLLFNGELLLIMIFFFAALSELRRAQLDKQAAVADAQVKSSFMATVSHELRTPLNGVIGIAELLEQTRQSPVQRQYTNAIISSGKLLLALISDILDISKISQNQFELEEVSYDMDQLLTDCAASFLPEMLNRKIPLYINIAAGTPFHLIGDPYRIQQVLFNLISNAIKFTEQGRVELLAHASPIDDNNQTTIALIVKDTGIGIQPESLEKIFKPFSQEDISTTRRFGGTGLGLYISKTIIDQMHGTITVNSQPNIGSEFTVQFKATVNQQAQSELNAQLQNLSSRHVVLIGDYPEYNQHISEHLQYWGATTTLPATPSEIQQQLTEGSVDVVVAFFREDPWKNLQPYAECEIPILLLHRFSLPVTTNPVLQRALTLPLPCSLSKLALSVCELCEHSETNNSLIENELTENTFHQTVLVVEDNPTNQMVILGMLKRLGIKADVAENGSEALDMCHKHHYDLIFMDCEMPVMDGYLATKKILQETGDQQPVIIALTAQPVEIAESRCKAAGMQTVLSKPLTLDALVSCLQSVIKKSN